MIATLERVRRDLLGRALDVAWLRRWIVKRDRRIAVHALAIVVVAAGMAIGAPVVALVVSPLVLGIPHLASELRWLVVRRAPARVEIVVLAGFAIALAIAGALGLAQAEVAIAASAVFAAISRTTRRRGLVIGAAAIAVGAAAIASSSFAANARDLAIAVHGFVGLAIWVTVFRRKRQWALPALAAFVIELPLVVLARGPIVGLAFVQSVHYGIWLAIVPQEATRGAAFPTVGMAVRGWRRDLGVVAIGAIVLAAIALPIIALATSPLAARDAYLDLARFHVWLELAACAWLFTERRS